MIKKGYSIVEMLMENVYLYIHEHMYFISLTDCTSL